MNNSMLVFLLSIFVLVPKVGIIDYSMLFILLISIFIYIKNYKKVNFKISKSIYLLCFFWFLLFALACFSFIYHGSYSNALMLKPIRQVSILVLLYISLYYTALKKDDIFLIFFYSGTINSLIVIIQYVSGILIEGNVGDFLMHPDYNRDVNLAWRKPGLMVGFPHASFMSAFSVLTGLYLIRYKFKFKYILPLLISFIALFLSARTGMILGLMGVFILLPFFFYSSKKNIVFALFSLILIIASFYILIKNEHIPVDTFNMMFELFINLANNKGLTSSSQSALFDSWQYPIKNLSTIFIGNGLEHNADNLKNVDAGFQQYLFGGGIFYMYITYMMFFYTAYISVKYNFKSTFYMMVVLLMFMFLFVASAKGGFIFSRGPSDLLLIIFVYTIALGSKKVYGR